MRPRGSPTAAKPPRPPPGLGNQLAKIKKSRTPRPVDQIVTEIYGGLHVKDVLCRVEGLGKAYGDKLLFEDLSFEIRKGNRIAVLGANGSGKSTLLKVLTGEEQADSGAVAWAKGPGFVSYNRCWKSSTTATPCRTRSMRCRQPGL